MECIKENKNKEITELSIIVFLWATLRLSYKLLVRQPFVIIFGKNS